MQSNSRGSYRLYDREAMIRGAVVASDPAHDVWLTILLGSQVLSTFKAGPQLDSGLLVFERPLPSIVFDSGSAGDIKLICLNDGDELQRVLFEDVPASLKWSGEVHDEPGVWPMGLAGSLCVGLNEVADRLTIEIRPGTERPLFTREEVVVSGMTSSWALKTSFANSATFSLNMQLPVDFEPGTYRLPLRLSRATTKVAQSHAELVLSTWSGASFTQLRRIRRARAFRAAAIVEFELELSEEEIELRNSGRLAFSVVVIACQGAVIGPITKVSEPPIGEMFEDGRLLNSFRDYERLAAVQRSDARDRVVRDQRFRAAVPTTAHAAGDDIPQTDIIVPVYNGDVTVLRCLESLQRGTDTPYSVIVIDDGSRSFTSDLLKEFVSRYPENFSFFARMVNRGYTRTINEALKISTADWVVILNSDTVVSSGWLRRLHKAAQAHPETGLVGPLSNAASWQSIPSAKNPDGSWATNDVISDDKTEQVQAILEQFSQRAYPSMPILNGFCTLIARKVFERCGLYDEDAFPLGYGEETDICLRALAAGFRLTVADDCFVYHEKSVSFGSATRSKLTRAGGFELANKHLGVNVPELERQMQSQRPMMRLRLELSDLETKLGSHG